MATITIQRDLVVTLKKETYLNVGILSKVQVMPPGLSKLIFKENALEKPTRNLFNHLSHYLIGIIDSQVSGSLSWPLYDTKTERVYRNEVSCFINDYSSKGLLSPVMSCYLVNPGCYKVTLLIFQLSQLAVQKLLKSKIIKESQTKLYDAMTVNYKSEGKDSFMQDIERETNMMLSKFCNYLLKQKAMKKIAEKFRNQITKMESTLASTNAQKYLDDLVDGFISNHSLDDSTKIKLQDIKKINKPPLFFEEWLLETDKKIEEMESKWTEKVSPLIQLCNKTRTSTQSLIARHTGEADRDTYMIEYNHETDEICTKDLQNQVNSQQKYILKNIVRDEKLNFPNLIRGFLISICFILKNTEIGDDIYKFNEHLEGGKRNYSEMVKAMRGLVERVMNAEAKLQPSPLSCHHSISIRDVPDIPPLPDLSDLRASREMQCQALFDSFTPLSMSKHQFNLRRKTSLHTFVKPQSKPTLLTPFYKIPKDDFMKTLISCRVSTYDRPDTQNCHNVSIVSQCNNRVNETIAECSSGFTKQQILRLLSTKKSSSSKKFKYKTERPDIHVKKGGLFNDSNSSAESNGLYRSYSSPNLFENKRRPVANTRHRKLSIMQEHSPTILEVSGITALEKDSSCDSPKGINLANFGKLSDTSSLPIIITSPQDQDQQFHNIIKDFKVDLNKEILIDESFKTPKEVTVETPKNNAQLIRKTNSLEKIINRFKKVRANVIPEEGKTSEFLTVVEEKEIMNGNAEVCSANRILLPDLLSPSCSVLNKKSMDYFDQLCLEMDQEACRKPRQSLGTALGVDHTFLDQFDLID